ncbi:VOC family protein [Sphingobium sp. V4]|uniref:VOC family protein n=1 Tax=Sphingobium sp. V4 TaxID=3038927 RepID=UPI0025582148|nr:VOC family protein [Sphingobium sp. V4]WIW88045.1 VOC family protein [Sphingobium sp. V4]
MAILGIESVIYGVDDLEACTRFWDDFGLEPVSRDARESIFEVASGSRVIVRRRDDTGLADWFDWPGVKLVTWGVDTPEALEALVRDLSRDREVRRDEDGTAYAFGDDRMPFALRLWAKRPVVSQPDAVNAPGCIQRLNQHRKWRSRARPKTLNHVVFFSHDYVKSFEFYRDRLGFRLTDHSEGLGVFARANGTYEHHSIFWVNTALPVAPDAQGFMHLAFGLEDIDEVMLGANIMAERGWTNTSPNSSGGLSRHRITSAIYYYLDNPNGGEAEYHCDTDYLDDNWVPRAWDWKFGSLLWAHNTPSFFRTDNDNWDMRFDPEGKSLEPFRKDARPALPSGLDAITAQDEHAL